MKALNLVLVLAALTGLSARADWPDDVVSSPAVQTIYKLLNQVNNGTCAAPKAADVKPFCLGALFPVNEPTIEPSGCMFSLTLSCSNGASAELSGMKHTYELALPNDKVGKPADGGITIDKVDLKP